MKRLTLLFGMLFSLLMGFSQQYVVTSVTGQVSFVSGGNNPELALRQILTNNSVINIAYKAQVELLEEQNKKKYILKVPGKGPVGDMLKDRQNSVMQLTEQYLAYMKARINGAGELTSRRHSDPATVTREVAVKRRNFVDEYQAFRQQAQDKYEKFRQKAISDYANFMRQAWKSYESNSALTAPVDEHVPPLVFSNEDKEKDQKGSMVQIEGAPVLLPAVAPQPVPAAAIREKEEAEGEYVDFELYGTSLRIRFTGKEQFTLSGLDENSVANVYESLKSSDFNNTIRDCLELRIRHQLSDWAYLRMLDVFSKACFSSADEATLLMAWLFQQSGYKMRLGVSDGHLVMLYASSHYIFGHCFFQIAGENFYTYGREVNSMRICEAAYPEEKPLSLWIPQTPMLAENLTNERTLKANRYQDIEINVSVNKNLLTFFNDYPSSKINEDPMTRWAMYANTPMETSVSEKLYPVLREKINGLDQKEGVERLLNWVQTAFEYKYDEEVWGHDRCFFAEETLYYPYCDCEDRSILLSRLVRDIMGLKTILVHYPGHLAMAVGFTEEIQGDYILVDGSRYVVCDPTYIGASVGMTMPEMNNSRAKIILLE